MDRRGAEVRRREFLYLAGHWIEPRDLVGATVIRNPEAAVLVGMRAPGHAVRPGQLVFHVDDLHRRVAERPQRVFILRQFGRRFRQHRVLAEHVIHVEDHVLGLLIVEAEARIHHEEAHGVAHVGHAVAPTVLVAHDRSHARLETVTGHAVGEQEILAARIGQELGALPHRDVAPAHEPLLQRKVLREALIRAQAHAAFGIGLEAGCADLQAIVAGRQVIDAVLAGIVGEHTDHDLGLRVARLHEGAADGSAVGPGDGAGYGGRVGRADREGERCEHSQKQSGC